MPSSRFWPVAAGLFAIALFTLVSFKLHLNLTTVAFLHLMVVVFLARQSGFAAASIISAIAVICQLYFFIPPVLSWSVADPHNLVALATFEYCALVVSRLSNTARRQTLVAERRQQDLEALYETSRLVLLIDQHREAGPQLIKVIQDVFDCPLACLFDSGAAPAGKPIEGSGSLESRVRETFIRGTDWFDEKDQVWFRLLRMGTRPTGALALGGSSISETVANALASLVAIALERSRSFENESRAEAARQSEHLRTAVLDALAHDVKTPLTSIRTASSGLLEAGALSSGQFELVTLIDNECAHITDLTNSLLRMARLDTRDVRLQRELVNLKTLIEEVIRAEKTRVPDRSLVLVPAIAIPVVVGDPQLLAVVLTQLINNAIKFSTPHSEIVVKVDPQHDEMIVSVHNFGPVIAVGDLDRIFERFYRAGSIARVAGTGLGLSIARKIVNAHAGRIWAASDALVGTTFFLALPVASEPAS